MSDADRFEEVDWEALDRGFRPDRLLRGRVTTLTGGVLALAFLYDLVLVGDRATVPAIGWDVTQLDWLFLLTLWALAAYVVVPLYENRRLTAYYWREFRRNRLAVAGLAYLTGVFALGLVGPILMDPPTLAITRGYQPPVGFSVASSLPTSCVGEVVEGRCRGTMAHPFGTTRRGRDVLKYIVFGMRVSMQIGLIGSLIVISIGTTVGTLAAYAGGMVDEVLMRYVDIQQTFPVFFLYLLINFLFEINLFLLIIVFSLFSWGGIARLVRSEALQRREEAYV
ncbi:MAG: ABC transporter permease, partial [Halobacteriales archaeon]